MARLGSLVVELRAETAALKPGLDGARRELGKVGESVKGLESSLKKMIGGFAVFETAKVTIGAFAKATMEAEQAQAKIAGVLKATGNSARISAEGMEELATSLSRVTNFDDEGILSAAGTLATFRSIAGPTFRETLSLATDMSAVFGQDLQSSVVQLGKALENPVAGLTALRRVGISFSETQRQMIEDAVKHGEAEKARKVILEEVRHELGGVAKAMHTGLTGALDDNKKALNEFMQTLGRAPSVLSPVVGSLNALAQAMRGVTAAFGGGALKDQLSSRQHELDLRASGSPTPKPGSIASVLHPLESIQRMPYLGVSNESLRAQMAQIRRQIVVAATATSPTGDAGGGGSGGGSSGANAGTLLQRVGAPGPALSGSMGLTPVDQIGAISYRMEQLQKNLSIPISSLGKLDVPASARLMGGAKDIGGSALSGLSTAFSTLTAGIGPMMIAFKALAPVAEMLAKPFEDLGNIIAAGIAPILNALEPVLTMVTKAFSWVGEMFFRVGAGITKGIGSLLEFIGKALGPLGGSLRATGHALTAVSDTLYTSADQMKRARNSLDNLADSADRASSSIVNAVSGYNIPGTRDGVERGSIVIHGNININGANISDSAEFVRSLATMIRKETSRGGPSLSYA